MATPITVAQLIALTEQLLEAGRITEAIQVGQRAVAQKPDVAEAWITLLLALITGQRQDEAAALIHRPAPESPPQQVPLLLVELLRERIVTKRIPAARRLGAVLEALWPNAVATAWARGLFLASSGRPDAALPLLQQATTVFPDAVQLWDDLAQTLRQLNQPEAAVAAARRTVALAPIYVPILHERLAMALTAAGHPEEAAAARRFAASHAALLTEQWTHLQTPPPTAAPPAAPGPWVRSRPPVGLGSWLVLAAALILTGAAVLG